MSPSKQCGELWCTQEVRRLGLGEKKGYMRARAVFNEQFLWGVIEAGLGHSRGRRRRGPFVSEDNHRIVAGSVVRVLLSTMASFQYACERSRARLYHDR